MRQRERERERETSRDLTKTEWPTPPKIVVCGARDIFFPHNTKTATTATTPTTI